MNGMAKMTTILYRAVFAAVSLAALMAAVPIADDDFAPEINGFAITSSLSSMAAKTENETCKCYVPGAISQRQFPMSLLRPKIISAALSTSAPKHENRARSHVAAIRHGKRKSTAR